MPVLGKSREIRHMSSCVTICMGTRLEVFERDDWPDAILASRMAHAIRSREL